MAQEQCFTRRLAGKVVVVTRQHLRYPVDTSRAAQAFCRVNLLIIEQE